MNTILIFINNKQEEHTLANYLKASDCAVKVTNSVVDFRFILKNSFVNLVIIDESVMEKTEDIQKILNAYPKLPYFYNCNQEKFPNILPASKIIDKPCSLDKILKEVSKSLNTNLTHDYEKEQLLLENKYTEMSLREISSSIESKFDYFIKISEVKYVKIIKVGEKNVEKILDSLVIRGVNSLYIKTEDYLQSLRKYTGIALNIKASKVPKEVKLKFLTKTSELIMDQIYKDGLSKEMFFNSKQILDTTLNIVTEDDKSFDFLSNLSDLDPSLYRHSLGMAVYSVLIAKKMDWVNQQTLTKLSIGALFADIGLRAIPKDIVDRSSVFLNSEEMESYKQHPALSAEFLSSNKDIIKDIIDIALQHHENCDGSGYPKMLTKEYIHPLARTVRVAHEFCEKILKSEHNPFPEAPQEIIKKMLITSPKKLDYDCVVALGKVFSLSISDFELKIA